MFSCNFILFLTLAITSEKVFGTPAHKVNEGTRDEGTTILISKSPTYSSAPHWAEVDHLMISHLREKKTFCLNIINVKFCVNGCLLLSHARIVKKFKKSGFLAQIYMII